MSPALIQALVVLALRSPATWLRHRGIERDARRWERHQQLVRAVPQFRAMQVAMKEAGEAATRAATKLATAMKAMQEGQR